MDFFEAVSKRCSTREYADKPLAKSDLEAIVDAGRRAPSARAVEPWEFVVATKKDTLLDIAKNAPNGTFIARAQAAIIIFCRNTKYYLEDGCAATENILLAAAALGIGSCWIAGDKKEYTAVIAKMFNAPADCKLVSIISLGYRKEDFLPAKKRVLGEVLHWERF